MNDFLCQIGETQPRLSNVPIKIGIIRRYQTGKSALLNRLRDINDDNDAQYSLIKIVQAPYMITQLTISTQS